MRSRTIILCLFLLTALLSESAVAAPPSAAQLARQQANCAQWQQAIESYNRALTASPKDAVCLARRGFAYGCVGNYKQAFSDFTSAIECDTNCPDAYSRRSRIYGWLGLTTLAKKDANKALGLIASVPKRPN